MDRAGRKLSLMLCSVPYVFGSMVIISAQNVWMLYVGRVLTGVASGITSLVVPVSAVFFRGGCRGVVAAFVGWWEVFLFLFPQQH